MRKSVSPSACNGISGAELEDPFKVRMETWKLFDNLTITHRSQRGHWNDLLCKLKYAVKFSMTIRNILGN